MYYKLDKEHIIPDVFSHLVNVNTSHADLHHLELDVLFNYNIILVKIYSFLISQILVGYKVNLWCI